MLALIILCCFVCFHDLKQRKIYNANTLAILLLTFWVTPYDVISIVASVGFNAIIGILLLVLNVWGSGDSKLIMALAPLFSPSQLPDMWIAILFSGGLLAVVYWIKYHWIIKHPLTCGLPYGVAIVVGVTISLYFIQHPTIYL
ncbi:A24 family peptidase [Vibrio mediterranei]